MHKRILAAVAAAATFACTPAMAETITFGPQTSTVSGPRFSRGYYFTAPTAFTFTSFYIPTDASTGLQTVEVLRLGGPPPVGGLTSTDFEVLGIFSKQDAALPISASISVAEGDILAVLGYRGDNVTSYAAHRQVQLLAGQPVTFDVVASNDASEDGEIRSVYARNPGIGRIDFSYVAGSVPETATWAMMVGGFGLIGGTLRRRSGSVGATG